MSLKQRQIHENNLPGHESKLKPQPDAKKTVSIVKAEGRRAIHLKGDLGDPKFCHKVVDKTLQEFGKVMFYLMQAARPHLSKGAAKWHILVKARRWAELDNPTKLHRHFCSLPVTTPVICPGRYCILMVAKLLEVD